MNKIISYARFYDLYAFFVLICIFIIVPFGIFPAVSAYSKKLESKQELQARELQIDQALKDARDMRYMNEDIQPYLLELNKAIPTGFSGEDFIPEILSITAQNNFLLKSVNISPESTSDFVSISVTVDGAFSNLENLSKSLEDSPYSIIIDSFKVSFPQRGVFADQTVTLQLRVYSLLEDIL
jgi:hypothetical protein